MGIADTMAISVACLRQMMDTHHLPPRRDSVAEQVPSPIGLSYICVNASYIAFGSYICLWQVILLSSLAVVVRVDFSPSVTSCHLPRQMEAFFRRVEDSTPYIYAFINKFNSRT